MRTRASTSRLPSISASNPTDLQAPPAAPATKELWKPHNPLYDYVFDASRVRKVEVNAVTWELFDPGLDEISGKTIFEKSGSDPRYLLIYDAHSGDAPAGSSSKAHQVSYQTRLVKTVGGTPYYAESPLVSSRSQSDGGDGKASVHWNHLKNSERGQAKDPSIHTWKSKRNSNEVSFRGFWSRVGDPLFEGNKLFKPLQKPLIDGFLQYIPPSIDNVPTAPLSDLLLYPVFVDRLIRLEESLQSQPAIIDPGDSSKDVEYHYASTQQGAKSANSSRTTSSLPAITFHTISGELPILTPTHQPMKFDTFFSLYNNVLHVRLETILRLCFAEDGRISSNLLARNERRSSHSGHEHRTGQLLWRDSQEGSFELLESERPAAIQLRKEDRKGEELWIYKGQSWRSGLYVPIGYFSEIVDKEGYPLVTELIESLFEQARQRFVLSPPRYTSYEAPSIESRQPFLGVLKSQVALGIVRSIRNLGWQIDPQLNAALTELLDHHSTSSYRLQDANDALTRFSEDPYEQSFAEFDVVVDSSTHDSISFGLSFKNSPRYRCVCARLFPSLQQARNHGSCTELARSGLTLQNFLDFISSKEVLYFLPPDVKLEYLPVQRGYISTLYVGETTLDNSKVWYLVEDDLAKQDTVPWIMLDHDFICHPEISTLQSLLETSIEHYSPIQQQSWKDMVAFLAVRAIVTAYYRVDRSPNSALTPLPTVIDHVLATVPVVAPSPDDRYGFASIVFHALFHVYGGSTPLVSTLTSISDADWTRPTMLNLTDLSYSPLLPGQLPSILANGKTVFLTGGRHSWRSYLTDNLNRVIGYVGMEMADGDAKAMRELCAAYERALLAAQLLRVPPPDPPFFFALDDASAPNFPWDDIPLQHVDELVNVALVDLMSTIRNTSGLDEDSNEIVLVFGGIDGCMINGESLAESFQHWTAGIMVWIMRERWAFGAGTPIVNAGGRNLRGVAVRVVGFVWWIRYLRLLKLTATAAGRASLNDHLNNFPNLNQVEIATYQQILRIWSLEAYRRTDKGRNDIGL